MKAEIKPRINFENRVKLEDVIPLKTPFTIFIDPSDKCNFKCSFCPAGNIEIMKNTKGRNYGFIDFQLYKKIIDDISGFPDKVKVIRLYKDGEPLLNPKFPDMVEYAKKSNCSEKVDTTTNGSLLNKDLSLKIIDSGLDKLVISVEGINEEQYLNFSNIKIDFDKFVKNIEFFYKNKGNCEVYVKTAGDTLNDKEKEKFYNIFGEISDRIFIENIIPAWPEYNIKNDISNFKGGIFQQEPEDKLVCPHVFYLMCVNSNGTVSACSVDWAHKILVGDTNNENIVDIWNSKKFNDFRLMFLKKKIKTHPVCSNCGQLKYGIIDNIDNHIDKILDRLNEK